MSHLNENYSNGANATALGTVNPSEMGQIFSYDENSVRMRKMNGYILVCLTDFAKPFPDKNLSHIVNSKELTDYVARMSEIQNCSSTDLLQVTKGGDVSQQGTWAHHRVAIRVAQKLSTDFAIWVDDKIEQLLTTGSASLQPRLPDFSNPAEAARAWAQQYEEKKELEYKNAKLELEHKENQPKVDFANSVMQSTDCISIGEMAQLLKQNRLSNMGQNRFYEWLRYNGFLLQRGSRRNLPSQKSVNLSIMKIAEYYRDTIRGVLINRKAVVTPHGQAYFIEHFRKLSNKGYWLFP